MKAERRTISGGVFVDGCALMAAVMIEDNAFGLHEQFVTAVSGAIDAETGQGVCAKDGSPLRKRPLELIFVCYTTEPPIGWAGGLDSFVKDRNWAVLTCPIP